jgi:hypothetical protein
MLKFLYNYNFLVLSLLFLLPAIPIYFFRKDLHPMIHLMALASLPFALTEFLFYPSYWEPKFVYDLIFKIGFGIEDLIFVIGLASFSSTSYPFFFKKKFSPSNPSNILSIFINAILLILLAFIFLLMVIFFSIPIIYGTILIMNLLLLRIIFQRKDLFVPALLGGFLSSSIYTVLCFILLKIYPRIFEINWHTEKFLNLFLFGIPAEEIIYGFSAGMISTIFYPFIAQLKYIPLKTE